MARAQVYWPRPVGVSAAGDGRPREVEGVAVEAVREEWTVEDRWWTPRPLRRRYYELVLEDGRNVVVFRELAGEANGDAAGESDRSSAENTGGHWFEQRA